MRDSRNSIRDASGRRIRNDDTISAEFCFRQGYSQGGTGVMKWQGENVQASMDLIEQARTGDEKMFAPAQATATNLAFG
jgi:hypothetical protein